MLEVLLDWAGDAYVDEAKLAADVNELVFEFEGVPLKDIRIGASVRQFAAIVREHSIVLPSDLSLMFKALDHAGGPRTPVRPGLPHHRAPGAAAAQRALARALPARASWCAAGAARSTNSSTSSAACRATSRACCAKRGAARRASTSISSAWTASAASSTDPRPRHDGHHDRVAGDRLGDRADRRAAARRVLGVPVLPMIGLAGYLIAFVNSLWIIYGIWRAGRE